MASIIVSPSEQRRFADYLRERTDLLMRKQRKFIGMLHDARAVCQDQRYESFRKKTEESARALEDFQKKSQRFVDLLNLRAQAGERYLRGR